MISHHSWKDRLRAAGGVVPDIVRAVRSASGGQEGQQSCERQLGDMEGVWGAVDLTWTWVENRSGTTFDRPAFQDLLNFCESNPRPRDTPGRVEWWAPHRFGHCLNHKGDPDILNFIATYNRFEQAGWELQFLKVPRIGDSLGDVMNIAAHAYAAAVYSE